MTAMERIKQIEKGWDEYVASVPIPYDSHYQKFFLKAFRVMRQIAVSESYREYAPHCDYEGRINDLFEERMVRE